MVTRINDVARWVLGAGIAPLASLSAWRMRRRIATFRRDQNRLAARYGISPDTTIRGFDASTSASLEAWANTQPNARFATTSGSTGVPKRVPYSAARISRFTRQSRAAGLRAFAHAGIRRPDLLVFAGIDDDDSFTALALANQRAAPTRLAGWMDPGRWLRHPDMKALVDRYGMTAVRLWLLAVCDPGTLYCTNPSTLAVFLDEIRDDWGRAKAFVMDHVARSDALPLTVLDLAFRRLSGRGAMARLNRIAAAPEAPPMSVLAPSLSGFACWDGGYVGIFLDRIREEMPADNYVHVPMYSMSTETVQTLPYASHGTLRFLPLADGVLYEFLPDGADDDPAHLLSAEQLCVGHEYTMVVSDPYGLRRYQTDDVFRCVGRVGNLPDLRFVRRRGLAWSFTGEKLTGEHIRAAMRDVERCIPSLATVPYTCVPDTGRNQLPGYRLVLAISSLPDGVAAQEVAVVFDSALAAINPEIRSKWASDRLAVTRVECVPYARLAETLDTRTRTDDDRARRVWESQFKLGPLTCRLWEDLEWT